MTSKALRIDQPAPRGESFISDYLFDQSWDPANLGLFLGHERTANASSTAQIKNLPSYYRALMYTDGTVSKLIEAYVAEALHAESTRHGCEVLATDHAMLGMRQGQDVLFRQTLLRGANTSKVHIYATSLLVPARLPPQVLKELRAGQGNIGKSLLDHKIESRRELLWVGTERAVKAEAAPDHLSGHWFASRTYRIYAGGLPLMLINERFPLYD